MQGRREQVVRDQARLEQALELCVSAAELVQRLDKDLVRLVAKNGYLMGGLRNPAGLALANVMDPEGMDPTPTYGQLLDALSVKSVVLMGINSNTCVLNTAFTAFNFDYRVVVLSDCVASMYGDDLHVLGLQNVARCLGWVLTNEQFFQKLKEKHS